MTHEFMFDDGGISSDNDSRGNMEIVESIEMTRQQYKDSGYALFKYDDRPLHSYPYDAPWFDNIEFCNIFARIKDYTLLDRVRLYYLFQVCNQVSKVQGAVLEVGVWRGGSIGLIASRLPDRDVYAADTFRGVVKSSDWEHYEDGRHADTSVGLCESLFQSLQTHNIRILEGVFPESTGDIVSSVTFALVHIDVDVFRSAKDIFQFVWSRMSIGGMVVFDDYGFISACPGIKLLVDEISCISGAVVLANLNGQAIVVKIY